MKTQAQPVISLSFYHKLMEEKESRENRAMAFHDGMMEAYMNGHLGDTKMFTEAYNQEIDEISRIDQLLKKYTQMV